MRLTWTQPLPARPRGLSLAREQGSLLTWVDTHWLYLLNRAGQRQAQRHLGTGIVSACVSDDGSACCAATIAGLLVWLAPDLTPRWQVSLAAGPVALAIDPHGQYAACADGAGQIHLFDRLGCEVANISCPRPIHHLAFVPELPLLVACAEYGFVGAFDLAGQCAWREGLVAHVGGLAVTGNGQCALACFSEGLLRFGPGGQRLEQLAAGETCRLVSVDFTGGRFLVGGPSKGLLLFDGAGNVVDKHQLEHAIVALALGPLGTDARRALADNCVIGGVWC